ncbi:MAG: CIS tube protein [Gammaproteobacteria bacterium]
MPTLNPFKLEKLTLTAYSDDKRSAQVGEPFKAMFNPETFSEKYLSKLVKKPRLNPVAEKVNFKYSPARELTFKLFLDSTGIATEALFFYSVHQTVEQQIEHLVGLAYHVNGEIHEPNFLVLTWGNLIFPCRLKSLDTNYTLFNRDGTPLRAELTITLVFDQCDEKSRSIAGLSSPDLTHSRIVKNGDTLPLLSKEIYGSSSHYLWIAQQNQLDDFRELRPGTRLFFPPLIVPGKPS